jgi:hypothetical protein
MVIHILMDSLIGGEEIFRPLDYIEYKARKNEEQSVAYSCCENVNVQCK